jgi:uncharacterized protein YabE (DUF348 family)
MVPVLTFIVVFFIGIGLFINLSGRTVGANNSRIVQLSISGKTQTIPTTAATVGDLISQLHITINPGDVVEPSESTPILQNGFQISIYRVHSVTVVEGSQKTVILTADNDIRAAAVQAGYTIYPQDYVTVSYDAPDLINKDNVIGEEIIINPATPINLDLYGNQVSLRTHAQTVADLLATEKIPNDDGNNVLPAPSTPITAGMDVEVVPVGQKLTSTQVVIHYSVETVPDPSIPYGTDQIAQAGVNGLALVVEDAVTTNGVTTENQLQQVVVNPAVPEIVNAGTGITSVAGGNNIEWLKDSDIDPSDYGYVNEIMTEESHWNPDDVNSSGCIGLGQSCGSPPGLSVVCPDWQIDAVCQLNFFNTYAQDHGGYDGWAGAAAHEEEYGWW